MIQIKRGKTKNWLKSIKPLADGQPGYDKDKAKLKIGDGKSSWDKLPYASGLSADEIIESESNAKAKKLLDSETQVLVTYGTELPNKDTIGQVYLQQYDADPETDYIISYGIDGIWTYQIWKSGIAKCWGTLQHTTAVENIFYSGALYYDNILMPKINYPIPFLSAPTEYASIQSNNVIVWLASKEKNTKTQTGSYRIISPDKQTSVIHNIAFEICGYINKNSWKN